MEEIEVKFLDIDKAALEAKLISLGAEKKGEWLYRRQVFDYPGFTLDKKAAWVRLRDEGSRIMLGYKQRLGVKEGSKSGDDAGMYEVEVQVDDFAKTAEFLYKLGLVNKFFLENKRVRYMKDGIEFDIDEWPQLEPYLEIEAQSWEEIDKAIGWLGLKKEDAKKFSTTQVYALAGIKDKEYSRITFAEMVKREGEV
jgi:adenylate cyclase class 2